jgi:aminoethylphosphonate catabolism LysR family transcriptional regulator
MLYTQIRAFDAVARAGSFIAAAEALGLSQPALSIQVRALEEAHGVILFQRRGRTIRLTRAGKELLELSRQFMRLEQQITDKLTRERRSGEGRLRLAFDGPHITMPMVARFRAAYPAIDLIVTMGNTRAVRQQLLEHQVDLAVLPRVADEPRVFARPILRHEPVVIVSGKHPWRDRRRISIQELHGQPMVAREAGSNTQRCLDEGFARSGVKPDVVLRLGSREAVKQAVAANLGFGVIWEREARDLASLHAIRLTKTDIESVDYLACLKDEARRWPVKAFFETAIAAVR